MRQRTMTELEAFLGQQGVDLDNRAFELELNCNGWRVVAEKRSSHRLILWIECAVDCAIDIPHNLTVAADIGLDDRDVALMRALERVLDFGVLREEAVRRSGSLRHDAGPGLMTETFNLTDQVSQV